MKIIAKNREEFDLLESVAKDLGYDQNKNVEISKYYEFGIMIESKEAMSYNLTLDRKDGKSFGISLSELDDGVTVVTYTTYWGDFILYFKFKVDLKDMGIQMTILQ